MQKTLRPYVTAAMAIAGASLIAVTPVTPAPPDVQTRRVALSSSGADILTPYEDLYTNTAANLQTVSQEWLDHPFPILSQIASDWTGYIDQVMADPQSITAIPGEILTHLESLLTTVLPDISAQFLPLPGQLSVELTGLLSLLVGVIGPVVTTVNEIGEIVGQVTSTSDPSAVFTDLVNAPAELINAFLNGQDTIDGIPFSGLLVAGQSVDTDVTLGDLLNGLGSLVNGLQGVLNAVGESGVNLSGLYDQVFDSSLGTLLGDVGQGNLSLATLLSDLPGVGNVTLGSLLGLDTGGTGQTLGGETVGDLLNLATGPGQTLGGSTLGTLLDLATGSGGQTLGGSTLGDLLNLATGPGQTLGGSTLGTLLNLATGSGGQTLGGSTLGDLLNLATGPGGQTLGGETLANLLGLATGAGGQTLGGETLGSLLGLATGPGQTLGGSTLGDLLNLATGTGGQTLGGDTLGSLLNLATGPGQTLGGSTLGDLLNLATGTGGQTLGGDTLGTLLNLATGPGQTLGGLTLGETTAGTHGGLLDALGLGGTSLTGLLNDLGLGSTSLDGLVNELGLGSTTLGPAVATIPTNTTLSIATLQDDFGLQNFTEPQFEELLSSSFPSVTFNNADFTADTGQDSLVGVSANTTVLASTLQQDLGLGSQSTFSFDGGSEPDFDSYLAAAYPQMGAPTPAVDVVIGQNFEGIDDGEIPVAGVTPGTTMSISSFEEAVYNAAPSGLFSDFATGDGSADELQNYLVENFVQGVNVEPVYAVEIGSDVCSQLGGECISGISPDTTISSASFEATLNSDGFTEAGESIDDNNLQNFLSFDGFNSIELVQDSAVNTGATTIVGVAPDTTLSLGTLQQDLGLQGLSLGSFLSVLAGNYPGMAVNLTPSPGDTVDTGPYAFSYDVPNSGLLDELGLGNMSLLTLLSDVGVNPGAGADLANETVDQLLNASGLANESVGTLLNNTTPLGLGTLLQVLDNLDGVTAGSGSGIDLLIYDAVNIAAPTLNDVNIDSLFSGITLKQFIDTFEFGGITLNQLLTGDGQTLDQLVSGLGLNTVTLSSLLSELGLGGTSLDTLVGNVGLGNDSLDQLVSDVGLNSMSLDTLVTNLGLNTTSLATLLGNLGLSDVSLDTLLGDLGLSSTSLDALLGDLGLSNVSLDTLLGGLGLTNVSLDGLLGDLGLSNVSLDTLLGGLGLNSVALDTLLGALGLNNVSLDGLLGDLGLNNVSLNGLLGDLGLSNVSLNGLLGDLGLSNVSLDGLLGDLGLNTVSLDTLLSGLNLSGVSVDTLLSDLNLGSLSLGGLLSDLGLDNMDVANIDVGPFDGLAPAGVDYLAEIAQALGA